MEVSVVKSFDPFSIRASTNVKTQLFSCVLLKKQWHITKATIAKSNDMN